MDVEDQRPATSAVSAYLSAFPGFGLPLNHYVALAGRRAPRGSLLPNALIRTRFFK